MVTLHHILKNLKHPEAHPTILTKDDAAITSGARREACDRFPSVDYHSIVGALIYLSSGTRMDITFAVSKLAKFVKYPGIVHFQALIWLMGYIQHTACRGIKYYHKAEDSPIEKLLIYIKVIFSCLTILSLL